MGKIHDQLRDKLIQIRAGLKPKREVDWGIEFAELRSVVGKTIMTIGKNVETGEERVIKTTFIYDGLLIERVGTIIRMNDVDGKNPVGREMEVIAVNYQRKEYSGPFVWLKELLYGRVISHIDLKPTAPFENVIFGDEGFGDDGEGDDFEIA